MELRESDKGSNRSSYKSVREDNINLNYLKASHGDTCLIHQQGRGRIKRIERPRSSLDTFIARLRSV